MVGMIFYDNANLTVPHNGGSSGQWFLLERGGTTWAAQVYTDGVLLDYVACSALVPVLTSQGYQTCSAPVGMSGTLYTVYRDTNSLSATYNDYYVNNVDVGATAPAAGSSTPNWVNIGGPFCSSCVAYQPQRDTNQCSPTYDDERNLSLGATAPCDYTANWVNRDINTYYVCVGVDKYYEQIDTNPCSPTYNTTQTGALYEIDSVDCGYTPPPTPTPTVTPEPASTFTINWSNNNITTGTNNLIIYNNGNIIVDQFGLGSGSFSVLSTDVIAYSLSSTTPDFTDVQIIDSVHGTIVNCGFNSSSVLLVGGVSYSTNATIDGVTTNYVGGCP